MFEKTKNRLKDFCHLEPNKIILGIANLDLWQPRGRSTRCCRTKGEQACLKSTQIERLFECFQIKMQ